MTSDRVYDGGEAKAVRGVCCGGLGGGVSNRRAGVYHLSLKTP